jgi:hypothetical protein
VSVEPRVATGGNAGTDSIRLIHVACVGSGE